MSASLASVARAVFDRALPPALITPAAATALIETLEPLPRRLSRIFGFECRLNDDEQTDLFLRIEPEQEGRSTLAGSGRFALDDVVRADPAWQRMVDFARAWEQGGTDAWRDVRQLWLEFDVPRRPQGLPSPGLFFWHPRPGGDDSPSAGRVPVERHLEITRLAAILVTGAPPDPTVLGNLERALVRLPGEAEVFCIGLGIERPSSAIRLCLKRFRHGEHVDYLAGLGVPGVAELAPVLDAIADCVDDIQLCFDVGATIVPKAHLELRYRDHEDAETQRRMRRLGDWLVARGLARPDKVDALLAWTGEPLILQLEGETRRRSFRRRLSHAKIAWSPGRALEAKGYFGVWETYGQWKALEG